MTNIFTTLTFCVIVGPLLCHLTLVSSNGGSSHASTHCRNGRCETCFNDKCFPRSYASVRIFSKCPTAACELGCLNFVVNTDNCPICSCGHGKGTREPCLSLADCAAGGSCDNYLCTYSGIPVDLPPVCDFDYQCATTDQCRDGKCVAGAPVRHVVGQSCVFQYQCPSRHSCPPGRMTCYESADAHADHLPGVSCATPWSCPEGYECRSHILTCIRSEERLPLRNQGDPPAGTRNLLTSNQRGFCIARRQCSVGYDCNLRHSRCERSRDGLKHVADQSCVFRHQCPNGFRCEQTEMSCLEDLSGLQHQPGISCTLDEKCDTANGFRCDPSQMTCVK